MLSNGKPGKFVSKMLVSRMFVGLMVVSEMMFASLSNEFASIGLFGNFVSVVKLAFARQTLQSSAYFSQSTHIFTTKTWVEN